MRRSRSAQRFRVVLLDVGGTLIDVNDFPGWTDAAHCLGVDVDIEALAHSYRVEQMEDLVHPPLTYSEWWRRVLSRASEREVSDAVADRYVERLLHLPPRVQLYSDTRRCLQQLRRERRLLGVVSNSRSESHLRELLEGVGILDYFATVLSSGTEGVAKPDPEIFVRAIGRLGVTPREAFFVGDLPNTDARAARAAGLGSVWLHRGGTGFGQDPPEITSLTELPGWIRRIEGRSG